MVVVGCDPSSSYVGLGLVSSSPESRLGFGLDGLLSIRLRTVSWQEVEERIGPVIERWSAPGVVLAIEQPPPTARKDRTKTVQQAAVSWPIGRVSGLLEMHAKLTTVYALPGDWRDSMLTLSARAGLVRQKPRRSGITRPSLCSTPVRDVRAVGDGKLLITFRGCGHAHEVHGYERLKEVGGICPQCGSAAKNDTRSHAEQIREEWKKLACEITRVHFPAMFATLENDARSRARDHGKEAWRLAGVPDACEAAWVAAHVARSIAPR